MSIVKYVAAPKKFTGLSASQVPGLQKQFGKNIFQREASRGLIQIIWGIVSEPMFILLLIACSIYFILGEQGEGFLMLGAMLLVGLISFYQDIRSTNALKLLQQYTEPRVTVLRDGKEEIIPSAELVPGDIILLEEGMYISADAIVLQGNDLSVNESVITGESMPVDKNETSGQNLLYQGTTINSGKCVAQVTATGNNTVLGKLGKAAGQYQPVKTSLQVQLGKFLRFFVLFGFTGFVVIFLMNFIQGKEWTTSLLFALTLAMSAIPEEIPVAFSSFMALGAYKMSKLGIISRQPQVIENLGAVTVFCFDKTGTLTENSMQVVAVYDYNSNVLVDSPGGKFSNTGNVLLYGTLASETNPFDPMEKAIWEAVHFPDESLRPGSLNMIFEYPLEGKPPMMTHVYEQGNNRLVAGKGAVERIIRVCRLGDSDKKKITDHVYQLGSKGYRVIAVCSAVFNRMNFPGSQDDYNWRFEGLIAFYDPMKKNIPSVLAELQAAQIDIKLLTGDYRATAINIAGQAGIANPQICMEGEQVMEMSDAELRKAVAATNVFCRMFPDAKVKVIDALKANGEVVAMTGDGVNDGPALKSANIGIALGRKGSEIARQTADLVLTDDNLDKLVNGVRQGRKIHSNLKKAIRYIVSIHIPIILTASLPLLFGWVYPNIFSPIHVIFLELIMGPTCSIFFEREPAEENIMKRRPQNNAGSVFTAKELGISILQGILIASGVLGIYYYAMTNDFGPAQTRTMVFTTLILANIVLTFVNRSFTYTIVQTRNYKNNLAPFILVISTLFLAALLFVPAVRNLFELAPIQTNQFIICLVVAFVSAGWFEVYKGICLGVRGKREVGGRSNLHGRSDEPQSKDIKGRHYV